MLNLSRSLPACINPTEVKSLLSCPLRGHVFHKPLDSGLRRNDDGDGNKVEGIQNFVGYSSTISNHSDHYLLASTITNSPPRRPFSEAV